MLCSNLQRYSIISSERMTSGSGMFKPRAFAAFRFTTSLNRVGCTTVVAGLAMKASARHFWSYMSAFDRPGGCELEPGHVDRAFGCGLITHRHASDRKARVGCDILHTSIVPCSSMEPSPNNAIKSTSSHSRLSFDSKKEPTRRGATIIGTHFRA